jgi:hypothetical protein
MSQSGTCFSDGFAGSCGSTSSGGSYCAWTSPAGDEQLSTGSFAMQSLWSNAAGGCVM